MTATTEPIMKPAKLLGLSAFVAGSLLDSGLQKGEWILKVAAHVLCQDFK
jgi:hypothetical protein